MGQAELVVDRSTYISGLVESVANALHRRGAEISASMRDLLASRIDELNGDAAIVELMHASIEGNIENIFIALRLGLVVDDIEPPSAAFEYARRLAQRGVPVSALVRAYRLGQQHLLEATFRECEALDVDPDARSASYQRIVTITFDYIDWISQEIVTVYEDERERWLAERNSARVGRIEDLIGGTTTDIDGAEGVIGYRLRVRHLGAVLWVHETGAQQDQISRFTRASTALAEHFSSRRSPLVIPRDRATAWAWFAVPDDVVIDLGAVRSVLAEAGPPMPMVAFGRPQPGLAGFRQSHLDAVQTQHVAMIRDEPEHPVTSFDEPGLSVAALLARQLETTRPWVRETLGDLALHDEQHERLRTTMRLFFQHDSSYTATAEAMLMHKNSVKYRIASAEKALGRPLSTDRQAIELALTACHWLGDAVLTEVR